jgi:hypothetical protein
MGLKMRVRRDLGRGWLGFGAIGITCVVAWFVIGAGRGEAQMAVKAGVEHEAFGKLEDGTVIEAFTLRNSRGASARVITYGATLTNVWVPDRKGVEGDVVLGFDDLKGYLGDHPHFGGIVGRFAERIA